MLCAIVLDQLIHDPLYVRPYHLDLLMHYHALLGRHVLQLM